MSAPKRLAFFERYLTVWVFLCMIAGVALGRILPGLTATLSDMEFGRGSQVNIPIGVLLWLMIYPMMLKVDFSAIGGIAKRPKGLLVTLFVNWLVKPFSMALLAWIFMQHVFSAWIDAETARSYTAGLIILAAAPCTAMVFVWSYLTDGDPAYTLVQVAVNDLIMLVAFAPMVMFLCGVANVVVPPRVLITSVIVFIVIPLAAGWLTRTALLKAHGNDWFNETFLPKFHPMMIGALAADAGADFRVSIEEPDHPVVRSLAHRRSHPDTGLFQFVTRLSADARAQGRTACGRTRCIDWREQFFRAGGCCCYHSLWRGFAGSVGDGCGRAGRSSCHAVRLRRVQSHPPMVPKRHLNTIS